MKRWICLMLALILCLSLYACGASPPTEAPTQAPTEPPAPTISPEELARQAAYHEKMAAALVDVDWGWAPSTNFKAVVLLERENEEGRYVDTYLDPYWAAEEPEEVRYLVECSFGTSEVGHYLGGGKAYRHGAYVRVVDLAWSNLCGEMRFHGGEPPESVQDSCDYYGSEVDPAEISEWITSVLNAEVEKDAEKALEELKYIMDRNTEIAPGRMREKLQDGGFSEAVIDRAMDLSGVDWNERARRLGEAVVENSEWGCSPNRFHEVLGDIYGLTEEQIAYAAQSIDWDAQAVKCAKESVMASSWKRKSEGLDETKKQIVAYLTENGFTQEQAEYAAEQFFS